MFYNELFQILKERFDLNKGNSVYEDINLSINTIQMSSDGCDVLYGSPNYCCEAHNNRFSEREEPFDEDDYHAVEAKDFAINSNKTFEYYIFKRADISIANGVIIFFHGLNEKKWDKYLPWAYEITQKTGQAVILFPIAFHMNRADSSWSDRHRMAQIAKFRKQYATGNSACSFVNAAISSRLDAHPQRLFWSGFQTYSDVLSVVNSLRAGRIKSIAKDATIDLFGYSIGAFLALILKMADPSLIFKEAKLFCFCGGMTIDRMFPISKYILDARAAIRIQTTFAELLSSNFESDERLAHFQNTSLHEQESWFKMLLHYNYYQKEREARIREIQYDIKALVLKKDEVAPPIEALNTLKGAYRDIETVVEIKDFNYEYSHVNPFPLHNKEQEVISSAFFSFVDSVCDFYHSKKEAL